VIKDIRADFPLLQRPHSSGKMLAYLDNAATTQKPRQVLDAVRTFYEVCNANPHRGAYEISNEATERYEAARARTAKFIGAMEHEIIFTAGATDSLNLVARSYGEAALGAGDEILISIAEHHSNLLPWQALAARTGAELRYLYTGPDGRLSLDEVREKIGPRTKIVAVTHVSNVLGVMNPVREIAEIAHEAGAVVVLDGAQSVPHMPVNVQELDVDFLAFSGHKMLAPTGIGVLYAKAELMGKMEPVTLGGGIVELVEEQSVRYMEGPGRFEAGSENVAGAVGLAAAMDYLDDIGLKEIQAAEEGLLRYGLEQMRGIPHIELLCDGDKDHTGIIPFNIEGVHPHDVATILDASAVAVRAGHHCAEPLHKHLGVRFSCRASFYFYNTKEEIDRLVEALKGVREVMGLGTE